MIYIVSNLTAKLYNESLVEIIKDDNLYEFQKYLTDVANGVELQYVDSLPFGIEELNKMKVPEEISRMKFKIQIEHSTIYSYDIILEYIKNLATNDLFTQIEKNKLIYRLEDAVSFNRYHKDFINLADRLGVSDEIKDEIFIEGNKIE